MNRYFPENIDDLIFSFLGIYQRKKCRAITQKKTVCKHKSKQNNLLCKIHRKIVEQKIKTNFSSIYETYKLIFTHHLLLRMKREDWIQYPNFPYV